jgi:hypothetical protein
MLYFIVQEAPREAASRQVDLSRAAWQGPTQHMSQVLGAVFGPCAGAQRWRCCAAHDIWLAERRLPAGSDGCGKNAPLFLWTGAIFLSTADDHLPRQALDTNWNSWGDQKRRASFLHRRRSASGDAAPAETETCYERKPCHRVTGERERRGGGVFSFPSVTSRCTHALPSSLPCASSIRWQLQLMSSLRIASRRFN